MKASRIVATALLLALGAAPLLAQAQYPDRPLRMIVPYAAGGPGDTLARQISPRLGVTGYDVQGLFGLMLPAGAPNEIIARLNAEAARVLAAPDLRARMRAVGFEPQPSTPQAFSALIESEIAKWAKVVRASGAKPD